MAAQSGLSPTQAPAVVGALLGSVEVQEVTNAATIHFDLQTLFGTTYNQKFLSIISGEKMFYMFSDGATDACDKTATSGDTRCDLLPATERRECFPPGRYLHIIADDTTDYVRLHQSSP